MPELSIIVPIYNGEEFLCRCIDSILSQQYTDFELILIDDGSTDSSLLICNRYAEIDSRIVVLHKENAGLVAARKSGLSLAKGEYIGFVDCDDFIDDNMYLDLMSVARTDNSDIVAGGLIYDFVTQSKWQYPCIEEGFYNEADLKDKVIPKMLVHSGFVNYGLIPGVVTKIFRHSVLEKAMLNIDDEITIGEDVAITAFSIMNSKSLSVVKIAAYHYVQYESSMVRVFNPQRLKKISKLYSGICKIENENYQKQVTIYMCYLIFNAIAACVNKSGYDKIEAKKAITEILKNSFTVRVLKEADISGLSFKNKVKVYLMRHNLTDIIMLLV
ncbi:MAG: glycosyltransferase [Clostridia bacterium]|nr:glycosyltransferase [Clostridia bacterium]